MMDTDIGYCLGAALVLMVGLAATFALVSLGLMIWGVIP